MRSIALFTLSTCLFSFGCGDDSGRRRTDGGVLPDASGDDSPADNGPLDVPWTDADASVPPLDRQIVSFCVELSEAMCAAIVRCDCGVVIDSVACRSDRRVGCELSLFGPGVRSALADGRLLFNASAASELVRWLGSTDLCTASAPIDEWNVRDYYTFGGVLEGTAQAGDDCELIVDPSGSGYVRYFQIDECAEGVCDARRCVGFNGVGGACDTNHFCADFDHVVRFPWDLRAMNLPCERPDPDAPSGRCVAKFPDGQACERGTECESDRCEERRCIARGAIGASCDDPRYCASRHCNFDSGSGLCAAGSAPNGADCYPYYQQFVCATDVCLYGGTGPGGGTCRAPICQLGVLGGLMGLFPR